MEELRSKVFALLESLQDCHLELAKVKRVATCSTGLASSKTSIFTAPHCRIPEPSFNSMCSTKDLENFIWDMEQYFCVT